MTRRQENPKSLSGRPPQEGRPNGSVPAQLTERARRKRKTASQRELTADEERIIQEAACYCLRHFPMLWTTGGLPEERRGADGSREWLIRVYLRYPAGHQGYLGDLLYDGQRFTELTDRALMRERARVIAADPDRTRNRHG